MLIIWPPGWRGWTPWWRRWCGRCSPAGGSWSPPVCGWPPSAVHKHTSSKRKVFILIAYISTSVIPTSARETLLISAASDSESDSVKRLFAPWMLRLMIWPFSSSFCSFRPRLSCTQRERTTTWIFDLLYQFECWSVQSMLTNWVCLPVWDFWVYIYIYAFSRRFYTKRLTIAFRLYIFISMCVPWESNPQPFVLLTQCSTTEPHRNTVAINRD